MNDDDFGWRTLGIGIAAFVFFDYVPKWLGRVVDLGQDNWYWFPLLIVWWLVELCWVFMIVFSLMSLKHRYIR